MRFIRFLQLYILMYALLNGVFVVYGFYRDCHAVYNNAALSTECVSLVLMGTCPKETESCKEGQDLMHTPDRFGTPWSCAFEDDYSPIYAVYDPCYKIKAKDCSTKPARATCEAIYNVVGNAVTMKCPSGEKMTYTPELFPGSLWRCFREKTYIKKIDKCDEINEENCYMRWGPITCSNISRNVRCPLQPGFCPSDRIYTYTPSKNPNELDYSEKWSCVLRNKTTIKIKYCHEVDIFNCHKYWRPFVCNNETHKTECPPLWVGCPPGQTYRFTPGIGEKNWSCHDGKVIVVEACQCSLCSNCHEHKNPVVCGGKLYEVVCPKVQPACPSGQSYASTPAYPFHPWGWYGYGAASAFSPAPPPDRECKLQPPAYMYYSNYQFMYNHPKP